MIRFQEVVHQNVEGHVHYTADTLKTRGFLRLISSECTWRTEVQSQFVSYYGKFEHICGLLRRSLNHSHCNLLQNVLITTDSISYESFTIDISDSY